MSAFRNRDRRLVPSRRAAACSAVLGVLLTATGLTAAAHATAPAARPDTAVAGNISWDSAPADPAPTATPDPTPSSDPGNISWDAVPADAV
ncbi:hypothetical protein V2S66_14795 [Streptomyces sp. V4-01]|uniref:Uncharacterized protein n=1 Tax=Actinacidiphila polyblastidii TaxID=3110430 RepID=A0ABU7PBQ2_9ACTN|nr:hypothetical protein [Streptomyces sp. V4-01]